jgi:hypothetical protein
MRKLGFSIFIILLFLLAIFGGKIFSKKVWDGRNKINIVFIGQKVFIFSLDPQEKKAIILSLPPKTFIETIHGYGDYPLESVYKLGEQESWGGGEFFTSSLQENLRIPIDGYVLIPDFKETNLPSKPRGFILACFMDLFWGRNKTNLKKGDIASLWLNFKKIRQDKISIVDLEKIDIAEKIILPDGTEGFKINPQKFKKVALEFFKDPQIRQENLEVAVLNSTSYSGLATRVADLIENMGGRVVEVGEIKNSKFPASPAMSADRQAGRQIPNSKCELRSKKELKKIYTLRKLEKVFGCQWQEEEAGDYRGDLVLIVGEMYWKMLKEK